MKRYLYHLPFIWLSTLMFVGCTTLTATPEETSTFIKASNDKEVVIEVEEVDTEVEEASGSETEAAAQDRLADVISVDVRGQEGNYYFSVGIASPDLGCEQYADWWEVLSEEGDLLYRRILLHSHVDEQPFTRSGGSVDIDADQLLWVRAHMNPQGYGGIVFKGSIAEGFQAETLAADFALEVLDLSPLPSGCNF